MKKFFAFVVILFLAACPLSACSNSQNKTDEDKIDVVCTFFPQYDWTKEIIGDSNDKVEPTLLLDSGVDLHSYQPTAEDIALISDCDLFIYVGGESDAWVTDVLASATNENMVVINLMDVLGDLAKTETIQEEMQHEEKNSHPGDNTTSAPSEKEESHNTTLDEHVWLSIKNTSLFSQHIAEALTQLDPDGTTTYKGNAEAFIAKLDALDSDYQNTLKGAASHTLLFGDRFPFRYLVDDYGIEYYAAFTGCSSETSASFETVIKLAGLVDELSLKTVMVTESSDGTLAKAIIENTRNKNQQVLTLNSMQSVTANDIASNTTYLSLAASNLDILKEALN